MFKLERNLCVTKKQHQTTLWWVIKSQVDLIHVLEHCMPCRANFYFNLPLADTYPWSQADEARKCQTLNHFHVISQASIKKIFYCAFHKHAAVNHNYHHKQRTQNRSKSTNHRSQTMTFFSNVLIPKRSVKMIDCSKKAQTSIGFWVSEIACFWKGQ